jgi:hypothetical protein
MQANKSEALMITTRVSPSRADLDAIYANDRSRRAKVLCALQAGLQSVTGYEDPEFRRSDTGRWRLYSAIYDAYVAAGVSLDDVRHTAITLCDGYQVWSVGSLYLSACNEILIESYRFFEAAVKKAAVSREENQ